MNDTKVIVKTNIEKILLKVFKKALLIGDIQMDTGNVPVDREEMEVGVHIVGQERIAITVKQYGEFILSANLRQGPYGYPMSEVVSAKNQFGFFAECLLDAFLESFLEEGYFVVQQSEDKLRDRAIAIYEIGSQKIFDKMRKEFRIDLGIVISISSMPYEREECQGRLYFSLSSSVLRQINFLENSRIAFSRGKSRNIRKLMEITRREGEEKDRECPALVVCYSKSKDWEVQGVATINLEKDDGIWIRFVSHMVWELGRYTDVLVKYNNGVFEYPFDMEKELLKKKTAEWSLEERTWNNLWRCVERGKKQRHGTILIIFDCQSKDEFEDEKRRIMKRGTGKWLENPVPFDEKPLQYITAIDGAVIMDTEGMVHGFGVILDGSEEIDEDTSRGARFNCSKRYIASIAAQKEGRLKAIAVIISEDGMVNFYSTGDYLKKNRVGS